MAETKAKKSFEDSITGLEEIINTMEAGELTLTEMLDLYSRGLVLIKDCHKYLDSAQKIVNNCQ
jgi:exodeoxyribonuclease VII small subunit